MAKLSKEDVKAMANFIGDQLSRINDGNGKAWKSIWEAAKNSVYKFKEVNPKVFVMAETCGRDYSQGFINGINSKNGAVYNSAYSIGRSATRGLKAGTDSHSPSKAAKKVGGFFGDGFVIGINDEIGAVAKIAKELGEVATKNLQPFSNFEIGLPSIPSLLSSFDTDIRHGLSHQFNLSDLDQKPINVDNHLKIELDGRQLETVITELQKDRAFMLNRDLLNL